MTSTPCTTCKAITVHQPFLSNGKDWEYGVPGTFAYVRCQECGLISLDPMPTLDEILSFYPNTYHGYQSPTSPLTRWLIDRNLRARARVYRELIGENGSILDVGAADGEHFRVWQEEGTWQLFGLEFNNEAASAGRAKGFQIETATIETYHPPVENFQLIIMNHLLEHVQNPLDTARHAYNLLSSGGVLIGEVPNIRSWDFFVFKEHWGGCHWPRHLHQFTPATIKKTLEEVGFTDVRISYLLHTSHWALSIQNFLQAHSLTKTALSQGRAWYYPPLLLCFLPLNMIQKILGYTGIIGFTAKKK